MIINWKYGLVSLIMLAIEVYIALYVQDAFVRPYIGDVLVIILIYTVMRTFTPRWRGKLPLYILLFAIGVEGLQYINILKVLGLQHNAFLSIVMGTVFDIKDIYCYVVGGILLILWELHPLYSCMKVPRTN